MLRSTLPLLCLLLLFSGPVEAAEEEEEGKPLDRFFRGRITALDKGTVTILYDFSDEKQKEDWYESVPFRIRRLEDQGYGWKEEGLEIRGNTAVQHVGEWKGDVSVSCRLVPSVEKDFGGLLVPNTEEPDFATFTLAEHYFHGWDNSEGGQHSIIKFGEKFRKRGFGADFTGFRYVARRPPPKPLIVDRSVRMVFGLKRSKLFLDVHRLELKGKDIGVKLKVSRPGFYVVGGAVRIDDVEITGRLDAKWLRAVGVAARLETPLPED